MTHTIDDFDLVKRYIVDNQHHHYTYTPKERKNINILIRGINHSYTPTEIVDELNSLNLENVNIVKCSEFKTKDSIRNGRSLDFFVLSLSHGSKIKQLIKIKYLVNQSIKFEKITKTDDCLQCHRCQRFGHSSGNCSMTPRCVKCHQNHLTPDCNGMKQIKNTVVDAATGITTYQLLNIPTCINCGKEGHRADSRRCVARQNYLKNLDERREANKIQAIQKRQFQKQTVTIIINQQPLSRTN